MGASPFRTCGLSRLGRWWALGLRGLASLAATEAGMEPQYRVWLHGASLAPSFISDALMKTLPGLSAGEIQTFLQRLHHEGKVVVWTGPLEIAEWHAERLRACGLSMSVAYQLSRWA
jgi:ATP-dependent Clp protease adapter protein ClpS